MAKPKRENLSKKIRFEVFKRDGFTCQYCGRMAPDVVLEVDHIKPVSSGGDNGILNLVTACFDCNRGKGKKLLTQNDEIKKQQQMLAQLNEKREQLEMLIEWKKELSKLEDEMVDKIEELLDVTGNSFSDYGRQKCKQNIKMYGFEEVYESAKISLEQYYISGDQDSATKTFDYIGRICCVRQKQKENPEMQQIFYLLKIGQNRFHYFNRNKMKRFLEENFEETDFKDLKNIFCDARNWTTLVDNLNNYYGVDGDGDL